VHTDPDLQARLDAAIAAAENRTDTEMVIVIERSSGSYRDVDQLAGAIFATTAVTLMLGVHLSFFDVADEWVVAPAVFAYVIGVVLSSKTFLLRRLLTSPARRAEQVKAAARVAFVEERVHATKTRNGVLFFFSDLEDGVEILADHGVKGRVDDGTWHAIAHELQAAAREDALVPAVERAFARVIDRLAARIPRTEARKVDEVARRLRVRS
jgi:uncharacterized membrane protein